MPDETIYALCRQKDGTNIPFIFAMFTSYNEANRAKSRMMVTPSEYQYWINKYIGPDVDTVKIGDECDYSPYTEKTERWDNQDNTKTVDHTCTDIKERLRPGGIAKRQYSPKWATLGSIYTKHPVKGLNYNDIGLTTTIKEGVIAEITENLDVTLNGVIIAVSPKLTTTKTGKEKARSQSDKLRFCKAVVWALINDETSLKDKLSDIGYVPPTNDTVKDFMIENITMSPFPGPAIVEEIEYTEMYAYRQKERDDRETIIKEYDDDPMESQYETTGSYLDADNNLETADEIVRSFCDIPVIQPKPPAGPYRSWSLPHLRCTILEVPI